MQLISNRLRLSRFRIQQIVAVLALLNGVPLGAAEMAHVGYVVVVDGDKYEGPIKVAVFTGNQLAGEGEGANGILSLQLNEKLDETVTLQLQAGEHLIILREVSPTEARAGNWVFKLDYPPFREECSRQLKRREKRLAVRVDCIVLDPRLGDPIEHKIIHLRKE